MICRLSAVSLNIVNISNINCYKSETFILLRFLLPLPELDFYFNKISHICHYDRRRAILMPRVNGKRIDERVIRPRGNVLNYVGTLNASIYALL